MKKFIFAFFLLASQLCVSQVMITSDFSNMLDLEQVLDIFCKSESTEKFEASINSDNVSHIDLNNDGYADYLRCIEIPAVNDTVYILIQACIGEDLYYDIASICMKRHNDNVTVYISGDEKIYGPTVIYPLYDYSYFLISRYYNYHYHIWHSPYHWKHYPPHYRPMPPHIYHKTNPYYRQRPISGNRHVTKTANPPKPNNGRNANNNVNGTRIANSRHINVSAQKRVNGEKASTVKYSDDRKRSASKSSNKPVNKSSVSISRQPVSGGRSISSGNKRQPSKSASGSRSNQNKRQIK